MRIGIGQLWQETNTFNPLPTTRRDFEEFGVLRGSELIEQLANTNEPGGFIQSLRAWPEQPELAGLVRLPAWPSGTATAEAFDWLLGEVLASLRGAGRLDGVLLALHGAMVAEEHPDVEGEVLQAVRREIGASVPLVATLDLHANVTERMVRHADALVLYHTAPHIDVFETGVRAANVLRQIMIGGTQPKAHFRKIPLVVPAERANTQDAASVSFAFRERLQALEREPGILAAGIATVQPWLDIPELGSAVLVVAEGDNPATQTACDRLASELWQRRRDYLPELTPLPKAVHLARECREGLVVLSDSADATTSGAPGDSTWLLGELLKYEWPRGALVTLVSPAAVDLAAQAGAGYSRSFTLGGVRDTRFSKPLDLPGATIERLFDAQFTMSGHLGKNLAIDMGRSAVLRQGDVRIIVTSRSGPHFAPELFQAAGIDPFAAHVLVAKSPCGFRAVYASRAAKIMVVQAPGCAPSDFWNYEYRNIPRPLWPWDEFEWQP
ncbi:MAG TPA: M81 family metallopeptidase [Pirellulaceae bacterium]|nr:M81 family metallopeptidase [Pirellulaceae bacterium]